MPHVSHEHRFVHLSIPYTKSTSTRKWLEREYGAEQSGHQHSMVLPEGTGTYFTWTTVRDPRERAVSLWRRIHRKPEHDKLMRWHFGEDPFPTTFEGWLRLLIDEQPFRYGPEPEGERQYWPQYRFFEEMRPIPLDRVFRHESIPDRLHELPFVDNFVDDFPHYSKNGKMSGLTWDDIATHECHHLLTIWAGEDFRLYEEAD